MEGNTVEFDLKDLEQYNGENEKPMYVVVDGKVYDVSESRLWMNGKHMNRHFAGQDQSDNFGAAPHGKEILQKLEEHGFKVEEVSTIGFCLPFLGNINIVFNIYKSKKFLKFLEYFEKKLDVLNFLIFMKCKLIQ